MIIRIFRCVPLRKSPFCNNAQRQMGFGSHMSDNDPKIIARETGRMQRTPVDKREWNETLATDSEADVKADRSPDIPVEVLVKETVEKCDHPEEMTIDCLICNMIDHSQYSEDHSENMSLMAKLSRERSKYRGDDPAMHEYRHQVDYSQADDEFAYDWEEMYRQYHSEQYVEDYNFVIEDDQQSNSNKK